MRSLLAQGTGEKLDALGASEHPSIRFRRSELLARSKDYSAALHEMVAVERALSKDEARADDEGRAELRLRVVRLSLLARDFASSQRHCRAPADEELRAACAVLAAASGQVDRALEELRNLPAHLRPQAAREMVAFVPDPMGLARGDSVSEVLAALAEDERTPPAKRVELAGRAARLAGDDANLFMTWAEGLESEGRRREAVEAWDQAARLAPTNERAILVPIRLLTELGSPGEARARANALRDRARAASDHRLAAFAFKYAGEPDLAVELAEKASSLAPDSGKLRAELAERYREAGRTRAAARVLAELLACGSHGRVWHRHEVAADLSELVDDSERDRLLATLTCPVVEPEDLELYLRAPDPSAPGAPAP